MMGLWAISGWKWKSPSLSWLWFFVTPWTVAHQLPLSVGFSRQEYWSGKSFPSPGDLPNPGIEPRSLELQADSLSKWQSSDNVSLPPPSPKIETQKVKVNSLSRVRLFATPWTIAYQAPPSMGFSRQEYSKVTPKYSGANISYLLVKKSGGAWANLHLWTWTQLTRCAVFPQVTLLTTQQHNHWGETCEPHSLHFLFVGKNFLRKLNTLTSTG